MSIGSFFKALVGDIEKIAPIALQIVGTVDPPLGLLLNSIAGPILNSVAKAEATITAPAAGATKADMAIADINAGLAVTQSVLAMEGKQLTYDGNLLQAALNASVAAFNAAAAFKASFKIQDAPKT